MSNFFETICAISTPLSFGGIGIVRISGECAYEIAQKIFNKKIVEGKINHGWVIHNNEKIDEAVVLYFKNPKSYTGEDVVEFQTHGSPVVIKKILNIIISLGARLADRGEFTKRAFLNGKLDLSEAEAVLDLINSKTAKSALKNASNLSGALSIKINEIREKILEIASRITASVDFPEDVAEVSYEYLIETLGKIKDEIDQILSNANSHNIMREGIKIAVVGRPNVGKSSLFNALLNLERAIVTDIAGTTRDIITESFEIDGVCATLIDTAGIRENEDIDKVEKIGINQAKSAIEEADIVLMLFDGSVGITPKDEEIFELCKEKRGILVSTKSDINLSAKNTTGALLVSSKTGENINKLKEIIFKEVMGTNVENTDFTTNQRQQESLKNASCFLNNAISASRACELQDLILIDVKSALISLGEITGEVVNDEILNGIFDKFCIGK